MSDRGTAFLKQWHAIVEAHDLDGLKRVLAESATLGAPPYWQKISGRDTVHHLLGVILETIEDFTYHRQWVEGSELALEFRGRVDAMEVQGIDLITIDDAGQLVNIDVMIRPLNAIEALIEHVAPRMSEFLAAQARD